MASRSSTTCTTYTASTWDRWFWRARPTARVGRRFGASPETKETSGIRRSCSRVTTRRCCASRTRRRARAMHSMVTLRSMTFGQSPRLRPPLRLSPIHRLLLQRRLGRATRYVGAMRAHPDYTPTTCTFKNKGMHDRVPNTGSHPPTSEPSSSASIAPVTCLRYDLMPGYLHPTTRHYFGGNAQSRSLPPPSPPWPPENS